MTPSERRERTWLCSVVFLDIAGYTEQSVTRQISMSGRLQQSVSEATAKVPESERIIVDTGDGAAVCYLGDPEEALLAAMRLRDALAPNIRIGINLGPVKVLKKLDGQLNPLGDGINNAQRVMGFAEPNQILVSRSFYEVIACLSQEYAPLFTNLGVRKDKHGKAHEVHLLKIPAQNGTVTTRVTELLTEQARAAPAPHAPARSDAELKQLAHELAEFIGPLAAVLVKKAASHAEDNETFYRSLADALPEGAPRQRFLVAHGVNTAPAPDVAAPPAARAWGEAELNDAERQLAAFLGPVAKVLVRRAAKETTDRGQFYQRLAAELASEQDRETFLGNFAKR